MTDVSSKALNIEGLKLELEEVLASPEFVRSPVMSRLLQYLVDQAIADPKNPPKAYHIAVEGLGKAEDFDVQADSYPRVQVGRLRKMLAAYYAEQDYDQRLVIPMGSYGLEYKMAKVTDEPDTVTADEPDTDITKAAAIAEPGLNLHLPEKISQMWHRRNAVVAMMILGAIFVVPLLQARYWLPDDASLADSQQGYSVAPTLYIGKVQMHDRDDTAGISRRIQSHFQRTFQPFHTIKLSSDENMSGAAEGKSNAYLLDSELVAKDGQNELQLHLVEMGRQQIVWSEVVMLRDDSENFDDTLNPAVTKIAGIYGAIANDQRAHLDDLKPLGHSCMLRFDEYRKVRDNRYLVSIQQCIDDSLAIEPYDPNLLSAASFLAFVDSELTKKPKSKKRSDAFAVKSLRRGKDNALAQFAVARSSFFGGDCKRGLQYAQKAVALNPLAHDLLVDTGAYLFACGDPRAEEYLNRAIALHPDGSVAQYTAMVFLKMGQGKSKEALRVAENIVPPVGRSQAYYDLAMAMVYAENGQLENSRTAWQRIEKGFGKTGKETPEQILGAFITSKPLIERGISLLRAKKVVSG